MEVLSSMPHDSRMTGIVMISFHSAGLNEYGLVSSIPLV